ncbi:hypothetical protein CD149_06265 [Staphylococcus condimenti]|uniref:DUF5325 family protein n=1 Tax=Staphylococcus condimenti TaxID=70255 RepID=A0A143P9I4_9STAP|nr:MULTISPECIES: DUF5325 family protein [Staphylococcus]AMY05147.1 hypothetical protein A4G25_04045 [Staphylococcus condimenti]APR61340.1 hypothetical protein BTZ13_09000 [Staphylococcus condimenti]MDK8645741.1 DUF5325 family protein [Staphylococcus condimenti]OFP02410.1 hypothetical protein HMPREF3007_03970 [Staphylococcus sp. HMSC065E08]PNZ61024.1 hypothetical protein CD149_06265 [Staphylococcus condimenti]
MQKKKSHAIFWVYTVLAVLFLLLFSFSIAAKSLPFSIITFVIMIGIFGAGFATKKKYRENGWL